MGTDCSSEQLVFEGFEGRQVVGSFDGGAVTSNGGAALLREADRAIGLTAKVARCFRDQRDPDLVVHRLDTMLAQRIHVAVRAARVRGVRYSGCSDERLLHPRKAGAPWARL